jgi:outer membrane protein
MPFRIPAANGLCLAAAIALCGCATIEAKPSTAPAEITVKPKTDATEHPSPPALELTRQEAKTTPATDAISERLELKLEDAISMALTNNRQLFVEELNPALGHTAIAEQRAVFDPVLIADYARTSARLVREQRIDTPIPVAAGGGGTGGTVTIPVPVETVAKSTTDSGNVGITQHLPTGADITATAGTSDIKSRNYTTHPSILQGTDSDDDGSNYELSITQPLLRGAWLNVNLASLRQARLDYISTEYELRGFVEGLVSQVEQTYWDCVLAQRQITIFEESLVVAQAQADEVEERIRVGRVPETERASAQAEVAQRNSSLIDARSNFANLRLALLRLVNPSDTALKSAELTLLTQPVFPEIKLSDIEASIDFADGMRPELNQARLQIKRGALEIVKTKNGLQPQLDLFLTWSKGLNRTSFADSFLLPIYDVRDTDYTAQAGVQFSYPIGNRSARARHARATISNSQNKFALANLEQLVEQDVRSAYIEVNRSKEQIAATAATRAFQEETLDAEREKYRLGRSPILLVSQAQRDLLAAQIDEEQAKAAYLKAVVNLYRLEGSLLLRRAVNCPGSTAVEMSSTTVVVGDAK